MNLELLPGFMDALGLTEEPMGIFYTESMPLEIFSAMLERYGESFLKSKAWETVKKKIERSKKAWGEGV